MRFIAKLKGRRDQVLGIGVMAKTQQDFRLVDDCPHDVLEAAVARCLANLATGPRGFPQCRAAVSVTCHRVCRRTLVRAGKAMSAGGECSEFWKEAARPQPNIVAIGWFFAVFDIDISTVEIVIALQRHAERAAWQAILPAADSPAQPWPRQKRQNRINFTSISRLIEFPSGVWRRVRGLWPLPRAGHEWGFPRMPATEENSYVSANTMLPRSRRDQRLDQALGIQIRTERARLDWSVDDLAEIIGLEPAILKLIESGSLRPTPRQLIQITQALGVSLTRLFFPH